MKRKLYDTLTFHDEEYLRSMGFTIGVRSVLRGASTPIDGRIPNRGFITRAFESFPSSRDPEIRVRVAITWEIRRSRGSNPKRAFIATETQNALRDGKGRKMFPDIESAVEHVETRMAYCVGFCMMTE